MSRQLKAASVGEDGLKVRIIKRVMQQLVGLQPAEELIAFSGTVRRPETPTQDGIERRAGILENVIMNHGVSHVASAGGDIGGI